ncbi:uncharacterized protein RSE6_02648 [Rhynchosporium secalis]|uniref:Uncharacterized protein n=1 Tax=Rhynchosporium secalis TaxID=38038 RepID=A0A1E1M0S7_RHYSE|nr:uncharacterized protein RSE6_02648 [Rhynchosporium secalis]
MRPRRKDIVYLSGVVFLLIGFSSIGVSTFKFHQDDFNWDTGSCQIGLGVPMAATIMGWDVLVTIFLTIVFVRRCEPYMVRGLGPTFLYPVFRGIKKKFSRREHKATPPNGHQSATISKDALVHVIRKGFWSCLGILASTVVNFVFLIYWDGREEVWCFFTFFTIDVTWTLIILHCLTSAPHDFVVKPQTSSIYFGVEPSRSPLKHGRGENQSTALPSHTYGNTPQVGDSRSAPGPNDPESLR